MTTNRYLLLRTSTVQYVSGASGIVGKATLAGDDCLWLQQGVKLKNATSVLSFALTDSAAGCNAVILGDISATTSVLRCPVTDMVIFPGLGDAGAHVSQIMDAGWATFMLSHWHRATGYYSMGQVIQKMTSGPARVVGLTDRGLIKEGMRADVNVFDADKVSELQPELVNDFPGGATRYIQRATGFKATIVNGQISLLDGELTGTRAGQVLRHSASGRLETA